MWWRGVIWCDVMMRWCDGDGRGDQGSKLGFKVPQTSSGDFAKSGKFGWFCFIGKKLWRSFCIFFFFQLSHTRANLKCAVSRKPKKFCCCAAVTQWWIFSQHKHWGINAMWTIKRIPKLRSGGEFRRWGREISMWSCGWITCFSNWAIFSSLSVRFSSCLIFSIWRVWICLYCDSFADRRNDNSDCKFAMLSVWRVFSWLNWFWRVENYTISENSINPKRNRPILECCLPIENLQ